MFEIVVSCRGVSEQAALDCLDDLLREFAERPWQTAVRCRWENGQIFLHVRNDYDSTGQAVLDEFSDAICACVPIEVANISFAVESVAAVTGRDA